ncbi:hypothetical protein C8R43DRAFT_1143017 [Mycena crocata]|nr:hypothetical protein C8R43DRAFT_1143017 [Mycena crocata]
MARPTSPAPSPFASLALAPGGFAMGLMPMMMFMPIILPVAAIPALSAPPAETKPDVKAEVKQEKTTVVVPPASRPGATLPAALQEFLRSEGPFLANEVYITVPTAPLEPIEKEVPTPEWYAITRGRFVGVVDEYALTETAISGVAHCARKSYTSQQLAITAFNKALRWGVVQIAVVVLWILLAVCITFR